MRDLIRRILRPGSTPPAPSGSSKRDRELAWARAMEAGELTPPGDVHDVNGWDTYWTNHLRVGPMDQGFNDMMSSDDHLIALLTRRNARTILCAGNGLSTEAPSLALHGFDVTALDLSRVVAASVTEYFHDPEHPMQRIPGFRATADGFAVDGSGPIPAELCPPIHRTDAHPPKAGGRLMFVSGDLTQPDACPGPFDVVIERRTVQLFPPAERELALDRLAARLAERGTLVSHLHDGCGGPRGHRPHHAGQWAKARGFVVDYEADADTQSAAPRVISLRVTTG